MAIIKRRAREVEDNREDGGMRGGIKRDWTPNLARSALLSSSFDDDKEEFV